MWWLDMQIMDQMKSDFSRKKTMCEIWLFYFICKIAKQKQQQQHGTQVAGRIFFYLVWYYFDGFVLQISKSNQIKSSSATKTFCFASSFFEETEFINRKPSQSMSNSLIDRVSWESIETSVWNRSPIHV